LAERFGVTRQSVAEWLSGDSAPTAETTLRLLEWVRAEEAKQQKTLGSVTSTAKGRKTRKPQSQHEKDKQVRKRR
jgi:transcriptional regulator with XRE-family HTH domain